MKDILGCSHAHFLACVTGMADVVEQTSHPRITHLFTRQMLHRGSHLSKGTLVTNRWMLTWHRSLGSLLGTFSEQRGLALGRRVFLLRMRQQ